MCFTFDIAMDVAFLISWEVWNANDFVGNLDFRWVLYNVFDQAGGTPTCLQLRTTDILIDRNWLLQFFAAQENHTTAGLAAQ